MNHVFDHAPYSRARLARLLEIHEAAYYFRRLQSAERTRERIYKIKDEIGLSETEVVIFLDVVNNWKFKQIRNYLLTNGSKVVRRGKKTRPRKKKK